MSDPLSYSRTGRERYWSAKRKAQLCEAVMANETTASAPIMKHIDDFSDEELITMIERYTRGGYRALAVRNTQSRNSRYEHSAGLQNVQTAGNA
jgi:hypothetical protein